MAPSTPPPPSMRSFAAFTIASTLTWVWRRRCGCNVIETVAIQDKDVPPTHLGDVPHADGKPEAVRKAKEGPKRRRAADDRHILVLGLQRSLLARLCVAGAWGD